MRRRVAYRRTRPQLGVALVDVAAHEVEVSGIRNGTQFQGLRKFPGSPNWREDVAGWGG